jgi:hypothetical protein
VIRLFPQFAVTSPGADILAPKKQIEPGNRVLNGDPPDFLDKIEFLVK